MLIMIDPGGHMARDFHTIAITGKHTDPRVEESIRALTAHLSNEGRKVLIDPTVLIDFGDLAVAQPALDQLVASADLMVAIGGDGTMLYAARLAAAHALPLLGVNRGRLGFLADIANREMLERVDEVLAGKYLEEKRLMLETEILGDGPARTAIALNDIVLQKFETGRMLDFETWIDGVYVNTHGGDGMVVATPTGSTAYALSGGGPILHPTMQAIVLVPICPHTLSDRPLVIGDDSEIEIRVLAREGTRSEVICDGRLLDELTPDEKLIVRRGPAPVLLIHPVDYDYFRILRSKLHWGRGNRHADLDLDLDK